MYYQPDAQKKAQWEAEIQSRVEITPEELLAFFDPELVRKVNQYQVDTLAELEGANHAGSIDQTLRKLISRPLLDSSNATEQIMSNNTAYYDDEIEDLIYEDKLLAELTSVRNEHMGDDNYSRLIRSRRTVLAHYIFSTIVQSAATV